MFNLVIQFSGPASSTTFSSGNVFMVEAQDPLINRVVVVTAETPQNADPQYLLRLRQVAEKQTRIEALLCLCN